MNRVDKHINTLLYTHDCVIIPGLGGLVSNSLPAKYDQAKNLFIPPSKEIVFNKALQHNDGLLVNFISNTENIPYEQAHSLVKEYVDDINYRLKNKQKINIANAGELYSDSDNNLVFTNIDTENFLADSFGLSSYHFSPVFDYDQNSPVRRLAKKATLQSGTKKIAAVVALITGLFFFNTEIKNPEINKAGGLDFIMPVKNTINADKITAKKETVTSSDTFKYKPDAESAKEINYFIIAGSFKNKEQAERFSNRLKSHTESNPLILKSPNGRFRVAMAGFNTKSKAIKTLKEVRRKKELKNAWILTQK
ncbi:MAG: hypothetical protein GXO47_13085 [Chlorobi bacterium]|nr:hypothetical protein [Chlorobiota bacterium]